MAEPKRTCVVCRVKCGKEELTRFVLFEGKPLRDLLQKFPGRGAYCCKSKNCVEKFLAMDRKWQKIFKK